ncbi:MAG TPA: hypothetical protein VMI52_02020 [Acetobacteraceae bacterium]|nr:hypothetical protein [Acetobacteraceae bacterium]
MSVIQRIQAAQPAPGRVSCRLIETSHLPAIIDLLHAGFHRRSRQYWELGLRRLAQHRPPEGFPQFGYMLQSAGRPVGVHLVIASTSPDDPNSAVRCNGSSWYVEEAFRSYGLVLLMRATRQQPAVYTNIDPRPATVPIIESQGFRQFSQGVFAALPLLARTRTAPVRLLARRTDWEAEGIPAADLHLLTDHAAFGCLGLWCKTPTGGQPLIFRRRRIKPGGIPCGQLIYCRSLESLEELAGPAGRFLAARGMPVMLVASGRPLRGVPGRFFPEKLPMYFKGAQPPRVGDLSYTEAALLGL